MKLSEMTYTRPDLQKIKDNLTEITVALETAVSFEAADSAFSDFQKLESGYTTSQTLAQIRHDCDTTDEFYDAEVSFFDCASPEVEEFSQKFIGALLESTYRSDFEKKYGTLLFTNYEIDRKSFSPLIIPEMQRENELVTEYTKLLASARIDFDGGIYTVAQMGTFMKCRDDEKRLAAWRAVGNFYDGIGEKLDDIYDELVHLRDTMGKKTGFENYIQLGYLRMKRNCYTEKDIDRFRHAVVKQLVPVADEIFREQLKRTHKAYPANYADCALEFSSGNPVPVGNADDILSAAGRFYHSLSDETAEFYDHMMSDGMMDVLTRPGKAGGGYCTSIPEYKTPFIFANFNGTSDDVETVTHEAGHAFANWLSRDVFPLEYQWPSLEACEVHSMSMEFFAWKFADEFYGKDKDKFYYSHLSSALKFIPYGTMVDHFQHEIYRNPDMKPAERHSLWKNLMKVYTPWISLEGDIPFYDSARAWQRQMHIYQCPFYYIDYCLAQTAALQFWSLIQSDYSKAWHSYMAYTAPGGTKTFTELIKGASLLSPFSEEALSEISCTALAWLHNFDDKKLL